MIDETAIRAALSDYEALWLTIYGEARGEPVEGQIAVASVIRNRVGRRWGGSLRAVCLAANQFSCWNPAANANHALLINMASEALGDFHERTTAPLDAKARQIKFLAQGIMNGDLLDNTHGADHYLTKNLLQSVDAPTWAMGKPARFLGAHAFLTLG